MGRKSAHAQAQQKYHEKIYFEIICPCCNCKTTINNYRTHSKSKKHLENAEVFSKDNPEFKQSTFNFKLINLRKYLAKTEKKDDERAKDLEFIFKTDPATYLITDLI
tara:strand:- start:82 stop:402 length:321 start_codon:yes stop_codon:yes gene_type:complete